MKKTVQEDLRVRKTKNAIRNTLKEMVYEMDYDQITVKELTARAQINRKTFYLHYQDLDDLLYELQEEIADTFIKKDVSYSRMKDIGDLVRLYFESAEHMPLLYERLLCSGSYRVIGDRISKRVMDYRKQTNQGAFGLDEYSENLVFAYCGANSAILYRQWVADGKKLSMEELISLATTLICQGMSGILNEDSADGRKELPH